MITLKELNNEFSRNWKQHFATQFSTLLVLTATFTVIFSIFSLIGNLQAILTKWGKDIQVSVFLEEEATPEQVADIEKTLKSLEGFQVVRFVQKEEAKNRFVAQMPGFAEDIVEDPEFSNPFPASFQLGGLPGSAIGKLPEIAKQLSDISGVEDVSYGQDWVQNYSSFISGIAKAGWVILFTLALGSLFVVSNSVRMSLAQRKEEIEILELVGATKSMIRMPYIYEGMVMGGVAAGMAVIISYATYIAQVGLIESQMSFLDVTSVFSYFGIFKMAALIAFGALSGAFGAYICVRRVNTGWAAGQK